MRRTYPDPVTLPKSTPNWKIKLAQVGDVFVMEGRSASKTGSFVRTGFQVQTKYGWLVLEGGDDPIPVTVVTIKGKRNEHTDLS